MKLNIKAFCVASVVVMTVPALALFIWCSATGFGVELVRIFESVHPSGGLSIVGVSGGGMISRIPGIAVNTLYVIVDAFIVGVIFSSMYNLIAPKSEK